MDTKKRIIAVLIVFVMILSCGCFGRLKARNLTEVKAAVTKAGYKQEYMSEYQGTTSTMGCMLNRGWIVYFFDYGKDKKDFERFLSMMDLNDIFDTKHGPNYTIYEGANNTNYWIYVRVDNTLLQVSGPKRDKEDIKAFVTELGYYKE